ncbi:MAG: SAF domain-containing protein, partial [Pseudonocardiaceae bacterium]
MGRWLQPRQHPSNPRTLAPLLRERWDVLWRGSGFGRTLLLRRAAAAVLVGVAAVLALAPGRGSAVAVVVAARDLAPGTVLEAAEVTLRGLPAPVVPDGAARTPATVLGRTLAAPVRRGEPLT